MNSFLPNYFAMVILRCVVVSILVSAQLVYAAEPSDTSITFTFAPPTETRYTETVHITRQKQATTGGMRTDELTSSSNISIQQTPVGWEVVVKPAEYGLKLNGRRVLDPFADLQSKVTITHHLDSKGQIINTDVDYAALMNLLSRELPPQELANVTPMIQQKAGELREKAAAEWKARVGEFIGRTARVGDVWEQDVSFADPVKGERSCRVRTEVSAVEACPAGSCVRITQTFYSSPADNSSLGAAIGTLTRLVDPSTMLIYEEKAEAAMEGEKETRVYEFLYRQ